MSGAGLDLELRRRADSQFAELAELPPAERAARLAALRADDPELARLVERLLTALERPEPALDRAAAFARAVSPRLGGEESPEREVPAALPGEIYGAWRIVAPLGRGGMSRVFVAERATGGFAQRAALKLFHAPAHRGDDLARRFEQERQIVAALEHPNIARVLDGGVAADGRPFLVLELVEGESIDSWSTRRQLDLRARVRLLIDVARAVQHAHRNLVVHRDLKPSNILVTDDGAVKLLDFGIAKLLDGATALAGMPFAAPETRTLSRPLTPAYASPEQVRGQPVTTASDVYQLGLLLYELLAGRPAHLFHEDSWRELERVVCEVEPPRLGSTSARDASHSEPIPSDLETIVLKAIQKNPARRYSSAEQLAEDLERFVDDRPVLARPDSFFYRAGKFVRRHRVSTLAATLIALLIVGGGIALAFQASRLAAERDRARAEARRAETVASFLTELFESSDPETNPGDQLTAVDLLDRGAERLETALSAEPLLLAEMLARIGSLNLRLGRPASGEALARRAVETLSLASGRASAAEEGRIFYVFGWALVDQGRYEESLAPLERAVALRDAVVPPRPVDAASARVLLGLALFQLSRFEKADRQVVAGIDLYERAPETPTDVLASAYSTLSEIRLASADLAGAEQLAQKAVDKLTAAFGAESPRLSWGLNDLGRVLEARGRLDAARDAYERSLAAKRKLYTGDHPSIGVALHNLARLAARAGDVDRAVALSEEALAIRERLLGPRHSDTAITRANLGAQERERLHQPRALALLRTAAADVTATLGTDSSFAGTILMQLGCALLDAGALDEAAALRPHAETILASERRRDHAMAALFLGRLAEASGQVDEALAAYDRAVAARIESTGPKTRSVAEAGFLALVLRARSGVAIAPADLEAAVTDLEPHTPRTARLVDRELARLRN